MRIAVLGGGGWGLALSKLLAENGNSVLVWEHNQDFLRSLLDNSANSALLPGVILPPAVSFTGSFQDVAIFMPEIVLLATPSQFIRKVLQAIPKDLAVAIWKSDQLKAIVNVAKGIEENTLCTLDNVLYQELPECVHAKICALSGPSHAEEVAKGIPTTVVIAGRDEEILKWLQGVFSNQYFRVYRSLDIVGVEIGGAVKNIIAIAAGIVSGLGFGDNTIGALLTRGIVEISRLGTALGAKPDTFLGLSGIGDLITTAISPHSRNRYVGFQIGSGKKLSEVLGEMKMVAEGVATTRSVYFLSQQLSVEMPIVNQVYQVLYLDKAPRQAISELMMRDLKAE